MELEEYGIAHAENAGIESFEASAEDANVGSKRSIAGSSTEAKKLKVDAKPLVYNLASRISSTGSCVAVFCSRSSSEALGALTIEEGSSMPSPLEMATNMGNALQSNHKSLSILGSRKQRGGKLLPAQLEAIQLSKLHGTPLGRFLDCQAVLCGKTVALIKFMVVRSSKQRVSAVHDDRCIGLFEQLNCRVQPTQAPRDTCFCPLSKVHLGQRQRASARNSYQKQKVVRALSDLTSALQDAHGAIKKCKLIPS